MKLDSKVSELPNIGAHYSAKLEKLNIYSIHDLLNHVPSRYLDFSDTVKIQNLEPGSIVTVRGTVDFLRNQYTRTGTRIQLAQISDSSGSVKVVWFNQPYLIATIKKGVEISIAGEVSWFGRSLTFVSPEYEIATTKLHTGRLVPIYPTTAGISTKWFRSKIKTAYDLTKDEIEEIFPNVILKKHKLIGYGEAVRKIHFPDSQDDITKARLRLSVNELFYFQLISLKNKKLWRENHAVYKLSEMNKEVDSFIKGLPFKLTTSQKRSVDEILKDLIKETPMNRLLEGDVGSGKTVVAAIACFLNFLNGKRSVFMAPTQILASQHYKTLSEIFSDYKIRIELTTSRKTIKNLGNPDILIGTHALLFKKGAFENTSLVVIDEQHKFGVKQRSHLISKAEKERLAPHVLTMTATPIPRSIALTIYGDLDLSTIDELPKGRIDTKTYLVPENKRESGYEWVGKLIKKEGIQVYVVCPLIDISEKETMAQVKAVNAEYEKLKKIFNDFKVGLLHGRMKKAEKDNVIERFYNGRCDILVTTPVIEVGIDVPNANIMIIEASERFGLSQLHQLRGRIGRGGKKSFCLMFTETTSSQTERRLSALIHENSGFKLAEIDLNLRGPGEVFGVKQHGFPELKVAKWSDFETIKMSKNIAEEAIENPKKWKDFFKRVKKFDTHSMN